MEAKDVKYLKEVQDRINSANNQLGQYMEIIQNAAGEGQTTSEDALMMLAGIISDMEARITELEGKING